MSDLAFVPSAAVSSKAFSSNLLAFVPWNISGFESDIRMFFGYLPQQTSAGLGSMFPFGIVNRTVSNPLFLPAAAPE